MRFALSALLLLFYVGDADVGEDWQSRLREAEGAAADHRPDEARRFTAEGVALAAASGASEKELVSQLSRVAYAHATTGAAAEARAVYELALERARTHIGTNHLTTLDLMANLAGVQRKLGNLGDAERLAQRAYAGARKRRIPVMSIMGRALNTLGNVASDREDFETAIGHYRHALQILKDVRGSAHIDVTSTRLNLAEAYLETERFERAIPLLQTSLRAIAQSKGSLDPELSLVHDNLGFAHAALGEDERAHEHYSQALQIKRRSRAAPAELALTLNALAKVCRRQGHLELSEGHFREALELLETERGPGHPDVAENLYYLGVVAYEQRHDAEAATHFERALAIWQATGNASDPRAAQIQPIVERFAPAVSSSGNP